MVMPPSPSASVLTSSLWLLAAHHRSVPLRSSLASQDTSAPRSVSGSRTILYQSQRTPAGVQPCRTSWKQSKLAVRETKDVVEFAIDQKPGVRGHQGIGFLNHLF